MVIVDEGFQMRILSAALPLAAAVLLGSARGTAAPQSNGSPPPHRTAPAATIGTHATRGVVKSIDEKSLVLSRSSGGRGDLRFVLNASTQRSGTVAVGSTVEVRYRIQDKQRIATAVSVDAHHK